MAIKHSVRDEYESVFNALGWRIGLLLPRHLGEAQWLMQNGRAGDGLLLSFSEHGFTAAVFRDKQPLILRTISCDPDECEDELYGCCFSIATAAARKPRMRAAPYRYLA